MKFKISALLFWAVLFLVFCVSMVSPIYIQGNDLLEKEFIYQPRWGSIDLINTYIVKTDLGLDACLVILSNNDDEQISGTLYLQLYQFGFWITIKNWSFSGRSNIDICKSYYTNSGKYRTKVLINIDGEQIKAYSNVVEIN